MTDSTRELPRRSDLPAHCATCGASTETAEWHATETVVHDGKVQRLLVFCDDRCKVAWKRQHSRRDTGRAGNDAGGTDHVRASTDE